MTWVYVQSEPTLWTVGFYGPDGKWVSESDHSAPELAAVRVAFLNGGSVTPDRRRTPTDPKPLDARSSVPRRGQGQP